MYSGEAKNSQIFQFLCKAAHFSQLHELSKNRRWKERQITLKLLHQAIIKQRSKQANLDLETNWYQDLIAIGVLEKSTV